MSDTYRDSIEALLKIRHQNPLAGMPGHYAVQYREGARAIIDAIRMGEVPTIYHLSQIPGVREYEARHDQDRQVIAGLRAEVEREKARADEMKGDGERAVMEERNRTAKAAAERDRLAGLLRDVRHGPGWLFIDVNTRKCIDAFLAGQPAPAKPVVDDAMVDRAASVLLARPLSRQLLRAALVAALEGRG